MCYVDLNPIRASIATTPIESNFTSIQQRLLEIARCASAERRQIPNLLPFAGAATNDNVDALPFNLQDYIDLIDASGRIALHDKRGAIPPNTASLLCTLGVNSEQWYKTVTQLQARFELFVGAPHRLRQIAERRGWRWVRGLAASRRLYEGANR